MGELTFADSALLWASLLTAGATTVLAVLTFLLVREQRRGIETSTRLHLLQRRLELKQAFIANVSRAEHQPGDERATFDVLRQQREESRYLFSDEVSRAMEDVESCIGHLVPFNVRLPDGRVSHREIHNAQLHALLKAKVVVLTMMDSMMQVTLPPPNFRTHPEAREKVSAYLG